MPTPKRTKTAVKPAAAPSRKRRLHRTRAMIVRVTPELFRKMKAARFHHDTTYSDMFERGVLLLLADEEQRAQLGFRDLTKKELTALQAVLKLMREGPEDAAHIVLSTLDYVRSRGRRRSAETPLRLAS
jgi:hypothetical protein